MNYLRMQICLIALLMLPFALSAADDKPVSLTGSLQHDGLFALKDPAINTEYYDFPYLSNTYLDLLLNSKYVSAGMRIETMQAPLPGFNNDFRGSGVGNLFVQGRWKWARLTLGDVYAQFGNGLILRLYEERSLGLDNSLRGGKLELTPYKGIRIEALGGKQRVYWNCYNHTAWNLDMTKGAAVGANLELDIDEWSRTLREKEIGINIGASWVSKYQPADTIYHSINPPVIYNLPKWVGATDARIRINYKSWDLLAEYAWKANDPSADNNYSYKPGQALLLSLSYSRKGLSVLAQVKRSENMSFRSDRQRRDNAAQLNHLPSFTYAHTYHLTALNGYATQLRGEWAFQGEVCYTWAKKTPMGGRYGTTLRLQGSHIRGTTDTNWWGMTADPYYTDVHLELNKRMQKRWSLNAMYMYQTFNAQVIEGHGGIYRSHILVADLKYITSDNVQMRAELQYLFSKQDEGQWIYALYELSLFGDLMLSASDMYNIGGTATSTHNHFYTFAASYQIGRHYISASYMRTREGYNCTGGICHFVPAQKGVTLNYSLKF